MKKQIFSVVGYNAAEIFLIFELKYFHENQFFSQMILTHESGAQEDQFDGKKRPKISWYYPFKQKTRIKSDPDTAPKDCIQDIMVILDKEPFSCIDVTYLLFGFSTVSCDTFLFESCFSFI
jgi:hypothetical protein